MRESDYQLYLGDCLHQMNHIPDNTIDAVITDLPFGQTNHKWDKIIPFEPLWKQIKRLIKPQAPVVFFAKQPFTSLLVCSNLQWWQEEWIWKKSKPTGHLNASKRPLRVHETIQVFCEGPHEHCYHPQLIPKQKSKIRSATKYSGSTNYGTYGEQISRTIPEHLGYPQTVLEYNDAYHNRNAGYHPNQKPVPLMMFLVETYSNQGNTILDCSMGSGSTGVACIRSKRNFIGIELEEPFFNYAKARLANVSGSVVYTEQEMKKRPHQIGLFTTQA